MRRCVLVIAVLAVAVAATAITAQAGGVSAASAWKSCGKIKAPPSGHFKVKRKGKVSCKKARKLMKQFLVQHKGKKHGGPAQYQTYYTLGHWKCGSGAGGGGCKRKHPKARAEAYYVN
ncbi:MAG TPA: hypothetical protein VGF21_10550 [Thermoleophilaceae bacterium]